MDPNDPFNSLMKACLSSPADESAKRGCSYFGCSDSDSDYRIPVDPVGIRILSPPASSEEEDVFQTPPESRSTATASSSDNRVVGKSLEPVVSERDVEETRDSKRLKSLDSESPSGLREKSPEKSDTDTLELLESLRNEHLAPSVSSASPNRNRILDVLLQLEKNKKEDTSLYGLSLLEVAEAKWGPFSERDMGKKNI